MKPELTPQATDALSSIETRLRGWLQDKNTPDDIRPYLQEAVICCSHGATHAMAVSLWAAFAYRLRTLIQRFNLNLFDAAHRYKNSGVYHKKPVGDLDACWKLDDYAILQTCAAMGLISAEKRPLELLNTQRNLSAHPPWDTPGREVKLNDISRTLTDKDIVQLLLKPRTMRFVSLTAVERWLECPNPLPGHLTTCADIARLLRDNDREKLANTVIWDQYWGVAPTDESDGQQGGSLDENEMLPAASAEKAERMMDMWQALRSELRESKRLEFMRDLIARMRPSMTVSDASSEVADTPAGDEEPVAGEDEWIPFGIAPLIYWDDLLKVSCDDWRKTNTVSSSYPSADEALENSRPVWQPIASRAINDIVQRRQPDTLRTWDMHVLCDMAKHLPSDFADDVAQLWIRLTCSDETDDGWLRSHRAILIDTIGIATPEFAQILKAQLDTHTQGRPISDYENDLFVRLRVRAKKG